MNLASFLFSFLMHVGASETYLDSFTCQTLPTAYSPFTFCSGTVNYPFFVSSSSSLAELDALVTLYVQNLTIPIGNPCLSNFKKLACGQFYLKCVPEGWLIFLDFLN